MATGGRSDDQHQAMISNAPGSFNEFKTHLDVCRSSSDVSDVSSSASSTFSVRNARVKLELARLKARQEEELSALEDDVRKLRTRHALQAAETESKVWEMSDDEFLRWVTVDRIRHDNSVKSRDFPPKSPLIDNGRENTPRRLPTLPTHTADSSSAYPVPPRLNHALHRRTVDLPKPEIAKFSGDPMEYYSFIRNFKAHVTDLVDDDNVRLSYLLQLCQGEAKNAIDHCSMMEPSRGYREAMRELKNEYGKDHVISRTCLDRLKRGPKLNFDDAKGQSITHEKLEPLLVDEFWRRWIKEYLPTITQRSKWTKGRDNFKVDDMVLLVDESIPRGRWTVGRVINTFPDKHGLVRSVLVRTGTNVVRRPITKLCRFLEDQK
ncbi:uncharacterized protein LOC120339392 isoform X2 [Styela clava]